MKVYDMYGPEGKTKLKTAILTKEEVEEEEKKGLFLTIESKEYWDVKGLLEWLPWKAWNIRKFIRTGRIKGRKIGRKWYVNREDLYSFLDGSTRE